LTGIEIELSEHDLFTGLPSGPWDLVACNPPYVPAAEFPALPPEVRDWDPRIALVCEGAVDAVARGAVGVLRVGGGLVVEVGDGQTEATAELLRELGYHEVHVTPDLGGRARVVEGLR